MTVDLYNLKSKIIIKWLFVIIICLYSKINYAQSHENGSQVYLGVSKESQPKAQNSPPNEVKDVTEKNGSVYVKCPKQEKYSPQNPVQTISPQLIDNKFQSKEMQMKYEDRLFEYEMWRLAFMQKLHDEQYDLSKQYGTFLFRALIGVLLLLGASIISSFIFKEKGTQSDSIFISIKEGTLKLKMNTLLFVLVVIILYLYHYYFTIIYPIN